MTSRPQEAIVADYLLSIYYVRDAMLSTSLFLTLVILSSYILK